MNFHENNNFFETIECCKNAIQLEKNNFDAWLLLALAHEENQQIEDSIIAYQKAVDINPNAYYIYKKLADIYYLIENKPFETIKFYEKFLEFQPNNTDAKGCLGLAYLKTKNYKNGWKYFEYRPHKERAIAIRRSRINSLIDSKPIWQGENIKDKILYVYFESGLGDTMMFSRYLPLLKNKCKKVLLEAETSNIQLLKDSGIDFEFVNSKDLEKPLEYEIHTPIMSLPYLLKLNLEEDIPFTDKYFKSDVKKVNGYKNKYFTNDKFKIGIKWQGLNTLELTRKIRLKSFYKLFDMPDTIFYSLQKDDGIEQLEDAKKYGLTDLGSTFNDFSDTAAAIENLDLVICNDTSVAHLAGALGKECWILLPFNQDWRWSIDLSYCPWYKSIRLFKQKTPGAWDEVLDRVHEALQEKILNL